jgi:hypothetical protein
LTHSTLFFNADVLLINVGLWGGPSLWLVRQHRGAIFLRFLYIGSRKAALMDQRWFRAANVSSAVRLYCFWFLVIFLTSMLAIGFVSIPKLQPQLSGAAPLPSRVKHYLQDPNAYSVIFLGDSRTYCAIHPELIERYVNTMHGLNLSNFAHWLPTQYSMVRDIVDSIPNDAVVVWSIGHGLFFLNGAAFDIV